MSPFLLSLKKTLASAKHTQTKGMHTCAGVFTLTKNLFLRGSSDSKWREVISLFSLG